MARSSVREYAVLYVGGRRLGHASAGGGNSILSTGVHAIDGPEHTGELGIDDLSDVDTVGTPPVTDDALVWNGSLWVPGVAGSTLTVEEVDGSPTDPAVTKLVFPNGSLGIAAHVATYTPPAGGSALTVKDEGTPLATDATSLDFVGAGVTASGTGGAKTITIPGGGALGDAASKVYAYHTFR